MTAQVLQNLIAKLATLQTEKTWLERWQTRVFFAVTFLGLIGLLIDVPQKISRFFISEKEGGHKTSKHIEQVLSGVIWDGAENKPLAGASVTLSDFDTTVVTNRRGRFSFTVEAAWQINVSLIAQKEGYETQTADPTLGESDLELVMPRKNQ